MKLALLLCGYMRGYKYNIDNLHKVLLDNVDTDIFMHISRDEDTTDKYANNNSIDSILPIILKYYNPISFICEHEHKPTSRKIEYVSNSLIFFHKLKQIITLKQNYEKLMEFKYDAVVLMRPDIYFSANYNFIQKNLTSIYDGSLIFAPPNLSRSINKGNFINDHIIIGNSSRIDDLCTLFDLHKTSRTDLTSEATLYNFLKNNKISFKIDKKLEYKLILSVANSIAIGGDSGAGKTTITQTINNTFGDVLKLECDRYHKWERHDPKWKEFTHLNPDANYLVKMEKDFFDLKVGNEVYQVDYDHSTGKFTNKNKIEPKEHIVLCGLHTLYTKNVNKFINLKIFMDPQKELKYLWKIQRDTKKRGYTVEQVLENIKKRETDFDKYINPQKEHADIIISYYSLDPIDYNLTTSIKTGLKLIYKHHTLTSLIDFMVDKGVAHTHKIERKDDSTMFVLDLPYEPSNEILLEFIKSNMIHILQLESGYSLFLQIVIYMYAQAQSDI